MSGVSREKIALVVFVACILLILAGIAVYLVAGHSWNYAATRIDDAAGEMEGYTVVLYEGVAVPASARVDSHGNLEGAPVSLSKVRNDYRGKGAQVLCIDTLHPERYETPSIIGTGDARIGVVSIHAYDPTAEKQMKVDYLVAHDVDMVLAIAPTEAAVSKVQGIDAYIDLNEKSLLATGAQSADGYRVTMGEVGTVGAIVISPADVVSARTVTG